MSDNGIQFRYTLVTSLAAALNMGIVLLICFWLMPALNQEIALTVRNADAIKKNHEHLEEIHQSILKLSKQINGLMDKTKP